MELDPQRAQEMARVWIGDSQQKAIAHKFVEALPDQRLKASTAQPYLSKLLNDANPDSVRFFFGDENRIRAFATACSRPDEWQRLRDELLGRSADPAVFVALADLRLSGSEQGIVDQVTLFLEALGLRRLVPRLVVPRGFGSGGGITLERVVKGHVQDGVLVEDPSPRERVATLFNEWTAGPKAYAGRVSGLPSENQVAILTNGNAGAPQFDPPDFDQRLRTHGQVALPARPREVDGSQSVTLEEVQARLPKVDRYVTIEELLPPTAPPRSSGAYYGQHVVQADPKERLATAISEIPSHMVAGLRELARGWPLNEVELRHGANWPPAVDVLVAPFRVEHGDSAAWSDRWRMSLWLGHVLGERTSLPAVAIDDLLERVTVQAGRATRPSHPERDGPLLVGSLLAIGRPNGSAIALRVPELEQDIPGLVRLRSGPAVDVRRFVPVEPEGPLTAFARSAAGFNASVALDVTSAETVEQLSRFASIIAARHTLDHGDREDLLDPRQSLSELLELPVGAVHGLADDMLKVELSWPGDPYPQDWMWKSSGLVPLGKENGYGRTNPKGHATAIEAALWLRSALHRGEAILLGTGRGGRMRLTDLQGVYADVCVWRTRGTVTQSWSSLGLRVSAPEGGHAGGDPALVRITTRYADTLELPSVLWLEGGGFHVRTIFGGSRALDWVPPTTAELDRVLADRRRAEDDDD